MIPDLNVRDEDAEPAPAPSVAPPVGAEPAAAPPPQGDPETLLNPISSLGADVSASESDEDASEPVEAQTGVEGEPAGDVAAVVELTNQVNALELELQYASRRADEISAIARRQSEMVDELHKENRMLRAGEIREAVAPLVRGLARLSDDLTRMRMGDEASADLTFLDGRVVELLHDCGVLPERPELGTAFDPKRHQATGSATTEDPHADRTIAELRRAGLRRDDGRMLRPADVVVYRYVAPVSPPPAEPEVADEPEPELGVGASDDDTASKEEVA